MPSESYMIASVQDRARLPENIAPFARSGAPTAKTPRQHGSDVVVQEVVELRRKGFRFHTSRRRQFLPGHTARHRARGAPFRRPRGRVKSHPCGAFRALGIRLAELPQDMVFFTQITMEAADDDEYLDAMKTRERERRSRRRRVGDGRRSEGRIQGLQRRWRRSRQPAPQVCRPRRPHPRLVSSLGFRRIATTRSTRPPTSLPRQGSISLSFVTLTPFSRYSRFQ